MKQIDSSTLKAMLAKPLPGADELRALFSYDPETGQLFWRSRPDRELRWNSRFVGKIAGGLDRHGTCVTVRVKGIGHMKAHRVIWKMVHGDEPAEIDHIDGNHINNRLSNLRAADRASNQCNVAGWCRSGLKGAYYDKRRKYWYSRIKADGRDVVLGKFDNADDAHLAYAAAAARLHGEFARINHKLGAA